MADTTIEACIPVDISDDDVLEAMRNISGYVDITPGDFREVYLKAYEHALRRLMGSVKVRDVMTTDVVTVVRSTSIREVAELMAKRRVSGVPVLETHGSVAGVISERDFLWAMGGGGPQTFMDVISDCLKGGKCLAAPMRLKAAEDIMSSPAVVVTPEVSVMEVGDMMVKHGINRVPVVDESGKLIGIASRADIIQRSR
jgi:CBS domain-containing protein